MAMELAVTISSLAKDLAVDHHSIRCRWLVDRELVRMTVRKTAVGEAGKENRAALARLAFSQMSATCHQHTFGTRCVSAES